MFELIVNILLLLFFAYALGFHVLEAPVPEKVARNPYALKPGVWPSVVLGLLIFFVIVNIIQIIRKNRGKETFTLSYFLRQVPGFLKSRQFLGMALVVLAALVLEPLGFMVTSFLVLFFYGLLLGDKKYVRLLLASVGITLILYVCFGVLLSVNLPRGTVPLLRDFSLFIEQLF